MDESTREMEAYGQAAEAGGAAEDAAEREAMAEAERQAAQAALDNIQSTNVDPAPASTDG